MTGFVADIETVALQNRRFREVLFTSPHSQLVVMSLAPGEEIGMEVHSGTDQFIRVERGLGTVSMNGEEHRLDAGSAVVVPAGVRHNIMNASKTATLQLYTVYSRPEHPEGAIHELRADALVLEGVSHVST